MSANIQLYSLATPNGQKVGIALEEMGLDYEAHTIDIRNGDQFTEEFIKINPNSKIPAIVDTTGNNGEPLAIMESGAILLHLAEKTGKFLPEDAAKRSHTLQWLFWQMGGLGPMFGQFGHFTKFAPQEFDLSYGQDRYTKETKRLLAVLDKQLEGKEFVIGDELTIADFSILPWIVCLDRFYGAKETLELNSYQNVTRWTEALLARPGFQKGMAVCKIS
ncbi:glutathione binding-like protein [Vibrio sp. JC009]|uniref:glutathione binding-like protein n=1 Tax=Vibrio sp. JC009 TaxID=2912314 RepID=UPI0023AF0D0A|nr:glutathione binding-like protein [Vibrio sp. JC009]WED24534.1 glutathione binding-like protein [Vibrio sp. JC009]